MQLFAASLAARQAGEPVPEGGYNGEYIVEWAAEMPDGADVLEWGEARAIEDHRETLAPHERPLRRLVQRALAGRVRAPSRPRSTTCGPAASSTTSDGAVWLRSTDFGDDKDRVLIKSDGEFTYLLPDIAYHRDKFARGFDLLINVWGADHHGYMRPDEGGHAGPRPRPRRARGRRSPSSSQLMKGGEAVKLSKRTGDIIELRDVLDEVGPDAARLTYLLQSIDSPQTFDIDVVTSQAMDNPVFYVQMAYARIRSIKRVAAERGIEPRAARRGRPRRCSVHERELEVLRALSMLPEVLAAAAADRAPHRSPPGCASWPAPSTASTTTATCMGDDVSPELTQARLWLVEAAEIGLAIGLDLLGVSAPESM